MKFEPLQILVITWEVTEYVMRDTNGNEKFRGPNTFHMSRWAFDQGAKQVVHNYKIDSNGIAEKAE